MAQGRRHKGVGKGSVPAFQFAEFGIFFEQLIKRLLIERYALKQANGRASGLPARFLMS